MAFVSLVCFRSPEVYIVLLLTSVQNMYIYRFCYIYTQNKLCASSEFS